MSNLTILKTSIRSYENLFSLNDLHIASGGLEKHRPSLFARNEQTKELIKEIENDRSTKTIFALKTIRGGSDISKQGTWACEELVLSYAMWISPKFHLIVLRAFLAMHRNQPQQPALPTLNNDFKQAMIKILNYASQYEVFQRAICTKRGEAQQRQMEFFFSEISDKESYLFVFKPNIAQDIQQASDLLHKLITQ